MMLITQNRFIHGVPSFRSLDMTVCTQRHRCLNRISSECHLKLKLNLTSCISRKMFYQLFTASNLYEFVVPSPQMLFRASVVQTKQYPGILPDTKRDTCRFSRGRCSAYRSQCTMKAMLLKLLFNPNRHRKAESRCRMKSVPEILAAKLPQVAHRDPRRLDSSFMFFCSCIRN